MYLYIKFCNQHSIISSIYAKELKAMYAKAPYIIQYNVSDGYECKNFCVLSHASVTTYGIRNCKGDDNRCVFNG